MFYKKSFVPFFNPLLWQFGTFYRTQDHWVQVSVRHRPFWDFTGVTLAEEDTKSIVLTILTDNAKRAIQGNVAMQVTWSGATWWPNLQLMQVAPSGGQICNLCKWCHVVACEKTESALWAEENGMRCRLRILICSWYDDDPLGLLRMETLSPSTRGCQSAWEADSLSFHSRWCRWFLSQLLRLPVFLKGIPTQAVDWSVESERHLKHLNAYHGGYYRIRPPQYEKSMACP